jgi:ribosomal protein S18 acetylase RimI-like enzyme
MTHLGESEMGEIRKMDLGDLPSVVDVHLASFTGFFLSSMGAGFLRKFYWSLLMDRTHLAFVYADGGAVTGFVVGSSRPVDYYRNALERNWQGFAVASIPTILKNPVMAFRVLRRLAAKRRPSEEGHALLMSIGVDPSEQGKGVGHKLVAVFLREAKLRGCSGVVLATDAMNNDPTNAFYLRAGFRLSKTYTTTEKRRMNEYVYDLSKLQG